MPPLHFMQVGSGPLCVPLVSGGSNLGVNTWDQVTCAECLARRSRPAPTHWTWGPLGPPACRPWGEPSPAVRRVTTDPDDVTCEHCRTLLPDPDPDAIPTDWPTA